jgi:3-mercaptopyruvate sulfurtransferase SseA
MRNFKTLGFILLAFILLATILPITGSAAPSTSYVTPHLVQDTTAAVRYFETELSFTTTPHGVNGLITAKEKKGTFTIVDVRAEADYKAGHIPGAINIPYDKWDSFQGNQTQFPGLKKDGINHVYCYSLLCDLATNAAKKFSCLG